MGVDRPLWRHVKTGGEYEEIACVRLYNNNLVEGSDVRIILLDKQIFASLQVSTAPPVAGDYVIVYQDKDKKVWARKLEEFMDGRFEPINKEASKYPKIEKEDINAN